MITIDQLRNWTLESDVCVREISPTVYQFDMENPYGEPDEHSDVREIRLEDGKVRIDWNWNGYGTQEWDDIRKFATEWERIMCDGLAG